MEVPCFNLKRAKQLASKILGPDYKMYKRQVDLITHEKYGYVFEVLKGDLETGDIARLKPAIPDMET